MMKAIRLLHIFHNLLLLYSNFIFKNIMCFNTHPLKWENCSQKGLRLQLSVYTAFVLTIVIKGLAQKGWVSWWALTWAFICCVFSFWVFLLHLFVHRELLEMEERKESVAAGWNENQLDGISTDLDFYNCSASAISH